MGVHRHPFFNRGIRVRYEVVTVDASRDLLLFLLYQLTTPPPPPPPRQVLGSSSWYPLVYFAQTWAEVSIKSLSMIACHFYASPIWFALAD